MALILAQEGVRESLRNKIETLIHGFGEDFYRNPGKFGQSFRIQLTAPNSNITQEELKNITEGIERGLKLYLSYQKISNTKRAVSELG